MSYTIKFSDPNTSAKPPIVILDNSKDQSSTSLTFLGKNYPGYGQIVAENFLWLLEHFAGPIPGPVNPVQGQLWYNNTDGKLLVNDGSSWSPVNRLFQQSVDPTTISSNVKLGDVWVDTSNPNGIQLKIYNGTIGKPWSQIGNNDPNTGSFPYLGILDTDNAIHTVIKDTIENSGTVIAIYAKEDFVPQSPDFGFSQIRKGINIPADARLNGASQFAYSLKSTPTSEPILTNCILRNDINQRISGTLSIGVDTNSLQIGYNNSFILQTVNQYNSNFVNTYQSTATSQISGKFTFNLQVAGKSAELLTVDGATQTVTIGDVGKKINGNLNVTGDVSFIPAGSIMPFAGLVPPTGWLICDGSTTSTIVRPALFGAIQYNYGGTGSIFNLPNLTNKLFATNAVNTSTSAIKYIIRY
jgi:hypothetical protein